MTEDNQLSPAERIIQKCEKCGEEGNTYEVGDDLVGYDKHVFCAEDAIEYGFCPISGGFYGGVAEEEIVYFPKYGMCSGCYFSGVIE